MCPSVSDTSHSFQAEILVPLSFRRELQEEVDALFVVFSQSWALPSNPSFVVRPLPTLILPVFRFHVTRLSNRKHVSSLLFRVSNLMPGMVSN